jgi:3-hydroxybutyryl-CoA dehydrogenase
MGEAACIEEFGIECLHKGFKVVYHLNSSEKSTTLPRGFQRSKTIPRSIRAAVELTITDAEQKKMNLKNLEKNIAPQTLLLSTSITVTVSEQSMWLKNPERLVGISALPTLIAKKLMELAPSIYSDKKFIVQATDFFTSLGKETTLVQDRIGMVLPRILCMLINEAFFAVMEGIAEPNDIDTAMKLGTNYPQGPLEWANKIGLRNVFAVLRALQNDLHEERYRIAPLLQQMALVNQWWKN